MTYGIEEYSGGRRSAARRTSAHVDHPGWRGQRDPVQGALPGPSDSKGSRVWDLDGNEYIDYSLCYAAMVAGHANPTIAAAIKRQAGGTLYGMPTTLAADLAEEIQRRYPVIDMIRFTQSASRRRRLRFASPGERPAGVTSSRSRAPTTVGPTACWCRSAESPTTPSARRRRPTAFRTRTGSSPRSSRRPSGPLQRHRCHAHGLRSARRRRRAGSSSSRR